MQTPNVDEVQAEEDEEEYHEEPPDNISEPDVETLNDFEEQGTEDPTVFEEQGTEDLAVFEGQGTEDPVLFEGQSIEDPTIFEDQDIEDPTVFEGHGTEVPTVVEEWGIETPIDLEGEGVESPEKPGEQGVKNPQELGVQGTETCGTKIGDGIQTLSDSKTPSIEALDNVIRQTFDSLDLDDESVPEKAFTPEDLSTTLSTLFLNNRIVDLEQHVHDLEAFNHVMKEQSWQKQSDVELLAEVKRQKQQGKVWKCQASRCYRCFKKVTKQLRKARDKNPRIVKEGINIEVQN